MSTTATDRLNAALEGRYRIESELGEGGMATVYLPDDLKHARKVVLKVLRPELAVVVGSERLSMPTRALSSELLRLDRVWDRLRGNPRFERLVGGS